jgi:hypothetical protein
MKKKFNKKFNKTLRKKFIKLIIKGFYLIWMIKLFKH